LTNYAVRIAVSALGEIQKRAFRDAGNGNLSAQIRMGQPENGLVNSEFHVAVPKPETGRLPSRFRDVKGSEYFLLAHLVLDSLLDCIRYRRVAHDLLRNNEGGVEEHSEEPVAVRWQAATPIPWETAPVIIE